jgi:single-strand DNA-binding protein
VITAVVTGNVGRDPEAKETKTGKAMTTFSVASTMRKDGRDPETTWVDVLCFDELAIGVGSELRKGAKVVVTGQMQLEQYQKKDGTPGFSLRLIANEVAMSMRAAKNLDDEEAPRQQRQQTRERREPW